jgi:hypothetical protein
MTREKLMANGLPVNDRYVPFTPAGSCLMHLAAPTEAEAWRRLLHDARHMPYKTKENFVQRGYSVEDSSKWVEQK